MPVDGARVLARRAARDAADRLRAFERPRRPAGGGRGLRRRETRPPDRARAAREAHGPLRASGGRARRRSRDGHAREPRRYSRDLGVEWITALKAPQVKRLARTGAFQPSLFDEHNLAEITSDEFPGERLVVCRNPLVTAERARKREALLAATEADLEPIAERVAAGRLTDAAEIGLAVGEVIKRHRVKKHFALEIADGRFSYARKSEQIAQEAALDGIYVLRTSVASERLDAPDVVRAYKQLKEIERDFRILKGPELEIRPIHHRLEQRVRAHVFLCTLALYLEWHLRQAWRELTFHDEHRRDQPDPVAKATRSPSAQRKAATKTTSAGQPAHTLRSLLAELRLQTRNTIRIADSPATFTKLANATPLQARALELADSITK